MPRLALVVAALLLCWGPGGRHAQAETYKPNVDADYFWEGGVLPFLYGSAGVAIGLRFFVEPVDSPNFFPDSEGGRLDFDNTVPEWVVTTYSLGLAGLVAASPNPERWHHLKGYAEAVVTTAAVTEIAKDAIGRHRPHFQEGMPDDLDQRRSFFSGHASITAASTVYMGLYLSRNLMPRPSVLKTASLLVLGGILVGVPYSRVVDHRHHLSDVVTGAAVGSALATVFYAYQESRFLDAQESFLGKTRQRLQVVPNLRNPGITLLTRW